ncbi:glycosyltransferase family 2 protein [Nocardioides sp. YIM 152315]|uniref:glycosyltransferase family 2 protein n=1 Tax=Nocardioides sp. YIM 152315 TaxID=3031760 RepID=UPI0023DAC7F1|nr:glycosyltransferase family 2 protein [Nocardioides sp. YIM 152315]MDF1604306.1 glycosyltransferase family 2 protein [Nocardioides sp. YIM 152315]
MTTNPPAPVSVSALTVLFGNTVDAMARTIRAFDNAARVGAETGRISRLELAYGDASPQPVVSADELAELRQDVERLAVTYTFFGENTGTSRGQNRLARATDSDFVLICNPDVIPDGRALCRMLEVFASDPDVGLVEAKQLPVEHPKDYDRATGETSWGSGAFSLVRRAAFEQVGGFDEDTFFLYCDDVDLSWRLREAGHRVVHQPAAVVFHDKQLTAGGEWMPTEAELYYSAEAALLLAHKWSRDDILDDVMRQLESSPQEIHGQAVAAFRERRDTGTLAARHDPEHRVGQFVAGNYAPHRFAL